MNLKEDLFRIKRRLRELWQHKIFRYAIIVHGFYFILSIILTLIFLRDKNDFLVYYKVGKVFINDINDLYNPANYKWPFRYLPLSAILFVPFYLLGFDLGFIFFNIINLFLNILICIILYKLILLIRDENHEKDEKDEKRVILYISLYLMSLPNLFNYILGQINLYIALMILISLFIFLKHNKIKWDLIASIILGISIIVKPIMVFMIPFLIVLSLDLKRKKIVFNFSTTIVRLIGVIIPILLNSIIFLLYPKLWGAFLTINLTGSEAKLLNHSFSITKLINNFCVFYSIPCNHILILLIMIIVIGGLGFLIYILRIKNQFSIIYGYLFSILIMLLVYFDSWDHHLLILTPILIIIIFNLPRHSEITKNFIKPSFFFLIFFDLAFMGIWFFTQDWFPINFVPTLFLILIFYGISKQCLKGD